MKITQVINLRRSVMEMITMNLLGKVRRFHCRDGSPFAGYRPARYIKSSRAMYS